MGWGYYVVARKNHGTDHEERKELLYLHKADDIFNAAHLRYRPYSLMNAGADSEKGTPEMVMSKSDVESLMEAMCTTPDYWGEWNETLVGNVVATGGFRDVYKICEIVHQYELILQDGWELVFFMA